MIKNNEKEIPKTDSHSNDAGFSASISNFNGSHFNLGKIDSNANESESNVKNTSHLVENVSNLNSNGNISIANKSIVNNFSVNNSNESVINKYNVKTRNDKDNIASMSQPSNLNNLKEARMVCITFFCSFIVLMFAFCINVYMRQACIFCNISETEINHLVCLGESQTR